MQDHCEKDCKDYTACLGQILAIFHIFFTSTSRFYDIHFDIFRAVKAAIKLLFHSYKSNLWRNLMKIMKKVVVIGLLSMIMATQVHADGHEESLGAFYAKNRVSISEVVKAQEKNGMVTEIEIEERDSLFSTTPEEWVYEVVLFNNGEYTRSYLDPDTSKVIDSKKIKNWNPLDWDDNIEVADFKNPEVSLSKAISDAETKLSGKVVEAELEQHDGIYFYEMKVLSSTGILGARVSPVSGELQVLTDDHE